MTGDPRPAQVLIVVESYWGNTAAAASAVASALEVRGIGARVVAAEGAPDVLTDDIAVLLVGAPTHNLSLPGEASRRIAGGRGVPTPSSGVREWIGRVRIESSPATYAFDTHTSGFSGSAARAIVKRLRRRGVAAAVGERFLVTGEPPALRAGELDRARSWGQTLQVGPAGRLPAP